MEPFEDQDAKTKFFNVFLCSAKSHVIMLFLQKTHGKLELNVNFVQKTLKFMENVFIVFISHELLQTLPMCQALCQKLYLTHLI